MHASVIVLLTFFLYSTAQDAPNSSELCGNAESWVGVLDGANIENCAKGQRCELIRGTNKQITLTFTPKKDITGLQAKVHGIIGELPVPFPVPQENACEKSGVTCPLKANEKSTYTAVLPIKPMYPLMSLQVKWELMDDENNVVVCKMIPVRIVKPSKSS